MSHKLTKDQINERLLSANCGIQMIGDYLGALTKTLFKCEYGHEMNSIPASILSRKICTYCYGGTLTKSIFNERLISGNRNIQLIGDFTNVGTRTLFRCHQGHEWIARPNDIQSGRGCRSCAKHGFDTERPASIYLLDYGTHLKYGITNSPKSRFLKHKQSGHYEIIMTVECSGHAAKRWENMIKESFGGRFVDKSIMPDGYTETLSPNLIQDVIKTMTVI